MNSWSVPRFYEGATVYCVGSGPSLAALDPKLLRGKPVVTCNSAAFWAEPLWGRRVHALFYDGKHIRTREAACRKLHEAGGEVATIDETADYPWVRYLQSLPRNGLCRDTHALANGLTCGHGAVNLAYHLGADRIVLLGYDMRVCRGARTHWDGRDVGQPWKYATHFARAFRKIAADLAEIDVSVLNATPHSALEAFPRIDLADAL
ncbi:MAG: hypothetical protein IT566_03375 [Rhodospirillaceae bacterium]|nr:hypothetical protein [Rhodospirillaceae bacterium]